MELQKIEFLNYSPEPKLPQNKIFFCGSDDIFSTFSNGTIWEACWRSKILFFIQFVWKISLSNIQVEWSRADIC